MKRIVTVVLLSIVGFGNISQAQLVNKEYNRLIDLGRKAFLEKQDSLSLPYYIRAFSIQMENPMHLYEASSRSARLKHNDLAFMFLHLSIEKGLALYDHVKNNQNYILLNDPRFDTFVDRLRTRDSVYTLLSQRLEKIYDSDQDIRKHLSQYYGNSEFEGSAQKKILLDSMDIIDNRNLATIDSIVKQYGYLEKRLKTIKARNTMSLIYIHAPLDVQEKNLEMLQKAVISGEMDIQSYAYVEDKIMIKKTGLQKYGTQYTYEGTEIVPAPLIEPDKVDQFRLEVGLSTLAEYLKMVKEKP